MQSASFADMLNSNLLSVSKIMENYEIGSLALREWNLADGKVIPSGQYWMNTLPDNNIFESGIGTSEEPFIIKTSEQLKVFAKSQTDGTDYSGFTIQLGSDIDISGETWQPIGAMEYAFNGVFDGAGHTISGLTMGTRDEALPLSAECYVAGLFGILDSNAVVKNLTLSDVSINVRHSLQNGNCRLNQNRYQ